MNDISVGISNARVGLVSDAQYRRALCWLIQHARRRVFASMFLVDLLPSQNGDLSNTVIDAIHDLRAASQRGVDVRLMIGGSATNPDIDGPADAARAYCEALGVACQLMSRSGKSSHKKLVVVDDRVLTGSHNWSPGAWSGQTQDSVLVDDPRLAAYFADVIAADWQHLLRGASHAAL